MRFVIILTPNEDDGYVAECPAIPGCISEGDTLEQAIENIREAIAACLETIVAHGWELPKETDVVVTTVEVPLPAMVS
ncbi:MAG: type II toxin-antitoxin system HicB family antitoxin [Armatimonadetes bacterium]|nr:type II toxin-antitoxin system HicB family antitoxin [Armatimonadota bacterium]